MCVLPIFLPPLLHEGFASYALSVLRPALHNVLETGAQRIQPAAEPLFFGHGNSPAPPAAANTASSRLNISPAKAK